MGETSDEEVEEKSKDEYQRSTEAEVSSLSYDIECRACLYGNDCRECSCCIVRVSAEDSTVTIDDDSSGRNRLVTAHAGNL